MSHFIRFIYFRMKEVHAEMSHILSLKVGLANFSIILLTKYSSVFYSIASL